MANHACVLQFTRQEEDLDIWCVGTSKGTVECMRSHFYHTVFAKSNSLPRTKGRQQPQRSCYGPVHTSMVARGGLLSRRRRLRTCRRRCADDVPTVLASAAPSKKKRNATAPTSANKHTRVGAIEQRPALAAVLLAA